MNQQRARRFEDRPAIMQRPRACFGGGSTVCVVFMWFSFIVGGTPEEKLGPALSWLVAGKSGKRPSEPA